MTNGKRPAIQFYVGDWMKDPGVRACSYAARGLWIDILCLAFEAKRRGFLELTENVPVTVEQLARMTGGAPDEVRGLLAELEDAKVFESTRDGVIYSRRLVRDEESRVTQSELGKRGGNPLLKPPTLKGVVKAPLNHPLKGVSGVETGGDPGGALTTPLNPSSSSSSPSGEDPPTPPKGGGEAASFVEEWNAAARAGGWPQVVRMGPERTRAFGARTKDPYWRDHWREGLARMLKNPAFAGVNDRNWKADVDWFLKPNSLSRVMEGKYDGWARSNGTPTRAPGGPGGLDRHIIDALLNGPADEDDAPPTPLEEIGE